MKLKRFNEMNENKRETTELEKEVFQFLNELRDSGVTNMFASPRYVQKKFGLDISQASKLVDLWMLNFNEDGDYNEIKE